MATMYYSENLVRPSYTYEDNIKMCFKEMEYDVMEWIQMFPDRDLWQDRMKMVMS
jgi:hypothetical protein